MRLRKLRVKGLTTAFPGTAEVEFPDGAGLVCLVGNNGAGKSTLLEVSGPGVLYRELPSYGCTLADHVLPEVRDALAELAFDLNGSQLTAAVRIDRQYGGGRGKVEAYLRRDGTQVAGPRVREYDEAIARLLPPKELFLASAFACQGGAGGFFSLPRVARKALIIDMLGLSYMQRKAEAARARAVSVMDAIERRQREVDGVREVVGKVEQLREQLQQRQQQARQVEAELRGAEQETQRAAARLAEAVAARRTLEGEIAARTREREQAEQHLAEIEAEYAAVRKAAADLDACSQRLEECQHAQAELEEFDRRVRQASVEVERARSEVVQAEQALEHLTARLRDAETNRDRAETALLQAREAAEQLQDAVSLEKQQAALQVEVTEVTTALGVIQRRLPGLQAAEEEERRRSEAIRRLREKVESLRRTAGLLNQVPGVPACGTCPLTANAREAAEQLMQVEGKLSQLGEPSTDAAQSVRAAQAELQTLIARRERVRQQLDAVVERLRRLERWRERAADLDDVKAQYDEAERVYARLRGERKDAVERVRTVGVEAERLEGEAERLLQRYNDAVARAGDVAAAAGALRRASDAAERLPVLERRRRDATKRLESITVDEERLQSVRDAEARLAAAHAASIARRDEIRRQLEAVAAEVAKIEGALSAYCAGSEPAERLEALEDALNRQITEAADWALLERSLSRDGLQAFELDAAGPAITALANDLLLACYGPRFTLALTTLAPKKTGGYKEVFEPRILDAETGREVTRGSGGEMVLLEEALRLALTLFQAGRSGFEIKTLWRDETVGALSPDNADRYVMMLRRAMEVGGFEQVLMVAHQPEVWQQADARLMVGSGQVVVE